MEEQIANQVEGFTTFISRFKSYLIVIKEIASAPLTPLEHEFLENIFPFAAELESLAFGLAEVNHPDVMAICAEMRELSTEFFRLALAHGNKDSIRTQFFALGEECQTLAKGKIFDCLEANAATRHYLLATSLGHSAARKKIQEICKSDPNKFCETFANDSALTKEIIEYWGRYLAKKHFAELSAKNQQLVQPLSKQTDDSLVKDFMGLFFSSSSSDDEQEKEKEPENDKNIQNSNINSNSRNPG